VKRPDDAARRFARGFDDFLDDAGSPFAASALCDRDPAETNRRIVEAMDAVLIDFFARAQAGETLPIDLEFLRSIHERLFSTTFPDVAGTFRAGHDEKGPLESEFSVRIDGAAKTLHGTTIRRLPGELERCFRRYHQHVAAEERDGSSTRRVAEITAETYARLLKIHPFLDGNLRACWCLMQAIVLNHGFQPIGFDDLGRHEDAIGRALQPGGRRYSREPLISLIGEQLGLLG